MDISIQNHQAIVPLNIGKMKRIVRKLLNELELSDAEMSILFVDDVRIQELNRRHLSRDKPTNVLAFPMREGEFATLHPTLLGDIVISTETAKRQSKKFGLNQTEMLVFLVIHGILHLTGYEHEVTKKGAREMSLKQKELFRIVIQTV